MASFLCGVGRPGGVYFVQSGVSVSGNIPFNRNPTTFSNLVHGHASPPGMGSSNPSFLGTTMIFSFLCSGLVFLGNCFRKNINYKKPPFLRPTDHDFPQTTRQLAGPFNMFHNDLAPPPLFTRPCIPKPLHSAKTNLSLYFSFFLFSVVLAARALRRECSSSRKLGNEKLHKPQSRASRRDIFDLLIY